MNSKQNEGLFSGLGVTDVLKNLINNDLCDVLPQTFKLFQLIAAMPATTASVERSFSCLKRITSAFRSPMCSDGVLEYCIQMAEWYRVSVS